MRNMIDNFPIRQAQRRPSGPWALLLAASFAVWAGAATAAPPTDPAGQLFAPPAFTPPPLTPPGFALPNAAPAASRLAPPSALPRSGFAAPAAIGDQARVAVEAGSGRVIGLPAPVANIFVSDPKIVEVRPASPTSLFLFGVAPGHTTVAALDAAGHAVRQFEVTVRPSSFGAAEAAGTIVRGWPGASVQVEAQPKRLVLNGQVPSPAAAAAAAVSAGGYTADLQTVDNRLRVGSLIQVGLKVRIAEMSRSVSRALGVDWQGMGSFGRLATLAAATGTGVTPALGVASQLAGSYVFPKSGASINTLIQALATDNLIRVLAEPNLVAMSGETASFLVGGEFPIPVAQSNSNGGGATITVDYKQYGVSLAFVPTVMSDERIRLHVRPEVSELTNQGAVQVAANGITIPALSVRRAETTIELGSGESFAIAGLLQDNTTQTTSALPWLGELPIIGALFHSDLFIHNETELVVIVTPYIVRPVASPTALSTPVDGYRLPNDLERLLLLRQLGRGGRAEVASRVPGKAGFVVE